MQRGVKRFAEIIFSKGRAQGIGQGFKMGKKSGWLKGSATTLGVVSIVLGGGFYIKGKYTVCKAKKVHQAEGKTKTLRRECRRNPPKIMKRTFKAP